MIYNFHYIKKYYDQRASYPKEYARNKILKLGVNGAWGKTAQSVEGKDGRPPSSASPWYAGVVTAGTRVKCIRAGSNAPWNIVHFATDGIQSNAPLGIENDMKSLGEWEMDVLSRGVYIKPGIYAFVNDFVRPEKDEHGASLDEFVADHIFKKDDEKKEKRNIHEEYFDYLDALAEDCYGNGRPTAILPHKKLLTFGGAASGMTHSEDSRMR